MFHNTTNLPLSDLAKETGRAKIQHEVVAEIFTKFPNVTLSPSEVWTYAKSNQLLHQDTPITSIRRAITTLTDEGVLRRTDEQRKGPFGKREYCWELKTAA